MKCVNCGGELSLGANFCGSCGTPLLRTQFCPHCGSPLASGDSFCGGCGARQGMPAAALARDTVPSDEVGDGEVLLRAIEETLSQYPQLQLSRGTKSDLEIRSALADARWGPDKRKVEYSASLLAREADRTVVYWEMIKEVGRGMGLFAGFKVESYKSDDKTLSGQLREVGWSPGGKVVDYRWDYAQTRALVEGVAKAHGWRLETTLRKGKAEH